MRVKTKSGKRKAEDGACRRAVRHFRLVPCALCLVVLAACAPRPHLIVDEGNYLTFEHPFTDAAAASVNENAQRHCGYTKRVAIRLSSTCSLKQCTTHYQCVSKADAAVLGK